jgi:hypothetical protein
MSRPDKVWILLSNVLAVYSVFLQPAAAQESSGSLQAAISLAQKVTVLKASPWRTEPTILGSHYLLQAFANNQHALSAPPAGIVSMLANAKLPVASPRQFGLPDLSKTRLLAPARIQQEKWQVLKIPPINTSKLFGEKHSDLDHTP